ncbi:type VII secretion protein EccCa [Mycolicibacterium peregrinum]
MKKAWSRKEPLPAPTKLKAHVLQLIAPLKVPVPEGKPWWIVAVMIFVVGMVLAMLFLSFSSGQRTFMGVGGIFPLFMVFGMIAMLVGGRFGGNNQMSRSKMDSLRAQFMAMLDRQRKTAGEAADELDANYRWYHPPTDTLEAAVGGPRMWERRPDGEDSWFGVVRVGRGMTSLTEAKALSLADPVDDMPTDTEMEPATGVALQEFIRCQQSAYGTPALISLLAEPGWWLDGDREQVLGLMRAVLAQMTFSHGPDYLRVMVVTDDIEEWESAKWLPHVADDQLEDAAGPLRMVYQSVRELRDTDVLANRSAFSPRHAGHQGPVDPCPHTVIISDVGEHDWSGVPGMSKISASDGDPTGLAGFTVFDLRGTVPLCVTPQRLLRVTSGDVIEAVPRDINTFDTKKAATAVFFAKADLMSADDFENFAQGMARWRLAASYETIDLGEELGSRARDVTGFYGITDPANINFEALYKSRRSILSPGRMDVPFGIRVDTGELISLNNRDMSEGGDGPHGLMVGTTGSGKTESLKTWILSLMCAHPPENLQLVLADFKGGQGVKPFEGSPHTACVITDLEEDQSLVGRFIDGLFGEIARRKRMLAEANVPNALEYNQKRIDLARNPDGPQLEPMPILQVVLDEFTQAFKMTEDMWLAFDEVGRQGRAYWIHMLLASQEVDSRAGKLLENCGYRVVLKTGTATSASTAGVPAALRLPKKAGLAYLRLGEDEQIKVQFDYLWRDYRKPGTDEDESVDDTPEESVNHFEPQLFSVKPNWIDGTDTGADGENPATVDETPELGDGDGGEQGDASRAAEAELMRKPKVGDVMLEQFRAMPFTPYRLFCPPLDQPRTIDDVVEMHLGRVWGQEYRYSRQPSLQFPVGIIDRPFKQDQQPLVVNGNDNLLVVGGQGSGKTTVLQNLICAAAMTHSPEQVQFYVLALSSSALTSVRELPHVGHVAQLIDEDGIRRIVAELLALLERRQRGFGGDWHVNSMDEFRARKAALAGKTPQEAAQDPVSTDAYGDVYLVVDNMFALSDASSTFRGKDKLVDQIVRLIMDGRSFGIHVIVSANRPGNIPPGVRTLFDVNRIELKMATADATLVRGSEAGKVPHKPGRGMVAQNYPREGVDKVGLHTLMARPALRGADKHTFESQSVVAMVARLAEGYQPAGSVHLLPHRIGLAQLQESAARHQHTGMVWAMNEFSLPVGLENFQSPFLEIVGEPKCGRTTTCAAIMTEIGRVYAPGSSTAVRDSNDQRRRAQVWLASPDRKLLRVLGPDYVEQYAYRPDTTKEMIKNLAAVLADRLPKAGFSVDQAFEQSWEGPEIFLVIDDGHRFAGGFDSAFAPLVDAANAAEDVGLHIIYTRLFGGWVNSGGRDPLVATMNQANPNLLVMDSKPDDGFVRAGWKGHPMPPGRGFLMGTDPSGTYVQVGWVPVDSGNG